MAAEGASYQCLHKLAMLDSLSADIDKVFVSNIVDSFLPSGKEGLDIIENYIWQHPDGNIEILLALYIEAIKKWLFVSSNPLILSEEIRSFLSPYTDKIFCNSSILKELAYELLFEAALIDHSAPSNIFDFDIEDHVLCEVCSERTNVAFRKSLERLSVQFFATSSNDTAIFEILADTIIESDYQLLIESISRILIDFIHEKLSNEKRRAIFKKAKSMRRIGTMLANLCAKIYSLRQSSDSELFDLYCGFIDTNTQLAIISHILKLDRTNSGLLKILVDITRSKIPISLNHIIPYLEEIYSQHGGNIVQIVEHILPSSAEIRFCSEENLLELIKFIGKTNLFISINLFNLLKERILRQPRTICAFMSHGKEFAVYQNKLSIFLSELFEEYINNDRGSNWEAKDSVIEILKLCSNIIKIDEEILFNKLIEMVKSNDENEYVQISATKLLCQKFPMHILPELIQLYKNQRREIRLVLMKQAKKNLESTFLLGEKNELRSEYIDFANHILAEVPFCPPEQDELLRISVEFCRDIVKTFQIDASSEELQLIEIKSKLLKAEKNMEGMDPHVSKAKKRAATGRGTKEEIEEVIETLNRECRMDLCLAKECF